MKRQVKKIFQSTFVKNVMVLVSGTAAAQAIMLILIPVITRLYGPEIYGLMGSFKAIINIIIPIAALTYPIAIVLPKSNKEAKGIIILAFKLSIYLSIVSLIVLVFFNNQIAKALNVTEISNYLYLLPLVIISAGLVQIIEQWLIRTKQFRINARVTFFQALIVNVSKAGVGAISPLVSVLIVLTALENTFKAGLMMFFTKKFNFKTLKESKQNSMNLKVLAKKYNDFPKYRAPQVFLNGISTSVPILLLTAFFGPVSAGFYTLGRTVLGAPSQLIGKAVGDVFYPRIAEASNNNENLTKIIQKATLSLMVIGLVPFGIVILFGPILFSFVFGSEWYEAGEYARWMALMSYFVFMNQPSIKALPVLSAQAFHLKFTIINVLVRPTILIISYFLFKSDIMTVALYSVTGATLNIILILITFKISNKFRYK